jgi:hypothetical protein
MYFLQNDESVPAATRDGFRRIGLPLDEFPDNDNLPYEIYVREARRIVGRKVFTEHDNMAAAGQARPPIHADSIAFTDWCMDSHDCTTDRRPGYAYDGKLILTEESRPAQVPYRCLLPQEIDNLLVPVCLSATHVAWGAVRLEPVWMQIGEAAGFAAALAKQHRTTPGALEADLLVRTLVKHGHLVTFFNEGPGVDVSLNLKSTTCRRSLPPVAAPAGTPRASSIRSATNRLPAALRCTPSVVSSPRSVSFFFSAARCATKAFRRSSRPVFMSAATARVTPA